VKAGQDIQALHTEQQQVATDCAGWKQHAETCQEESDRLRDELARMKTEQQKTLTELQAETDNMKLATVGQPYITAFFLT